MVPRAVLVERPSEYDELLARHATHEQVRFFLERRERSLEEVLERHATLAATHRAVLGAVPADWRTATVRRGDLDRFLFEPGDVVLALGQDGLVANVAKYLSGQPVVGIDTDPGRNPGVLVRHRPAAARRLLPHAALPAARADELTMVEAVADDTQRLTALNEIYLGAPGHRTARYRLALDGRGATAESQASSGVLIGTGTGATGWIRSVWQERPEPGRPALPGPTEDRLLWYVREAWPSPGTGTSLVAGELAARGRLSLTVESEHLVAFGDGMEDDALDLTWGQTVRVGVCADRLRLV